MKTRAASGALRYGFDNADRDTIFAEKALQNIVILGLVVDPEIFATVPVESGRARPGR